MERFEWLYYEILSQATNVKATILAFLGNLPFLRELPDRVLQWIFIAVTFVTAIFLIYPLIKWSARVAVGAAILAALLTIFTSASFWALLPFTGLGVAIVLFSNRFQTE
jgi:hypothetical protein